MKIDWRKLSAGAALVLAILLIVGAGSIALDIVQSEDDLAGRFPGSIPLLCAAAIALAACVVLASDIRLDPKAAWAVVRSQELSLVVALSLLTIVVGGKYCAPVAGGADAYGYVSQADLWLDGELRIRESWLSNVPWPAAIWTFCPLGYVPANGGFDDLTLVPMYSPGLPLLMASAKFLFGQCAMFAIVPLSGGVLVLMTYFIARRLGLGRAGVIGAWFVATSPTLLYMLAWPMSDVPVAAALAASFYFLVGPGLRNAVLAGLTVSLGILVRPNLFFAAPVFGLFFVVEGILGKREARLGRARQALVFAAGTLPGIVITALLNHHLNGSAFRSGYAALGIGLDVSNVLPNFIRYSGWLLETQTPIVIAGIGALLVPRLELWPGLSARSAPWIMAAFVACLFGMYFAYIVFDAWWFMRFLLPAWPMMMIATGSVVVAATPVIGRVGRLVLFFMTLAIGINGYVQAERRSAFDLWKEGKKYVAAAELAAENTPPGSIIMAMQHSGSIRYYTGRLTLRYDSLDAAWLDRAVAWLAQRGIKTYFLGDEWEITTFKEKFAGQKTTERLTDPPLFEYAGSNRVLLFDLSDARPEAAHVESRVELFDGFPCRSPVPLNNPLTKAVQ